MSQHETTSAHDTTSAAVPPPRLTVGAPAAAADESTLEDDLGPDKPEGPVSAAIIASGVGAAALGLVTTLAEASVTVKDWLRWDDGVGPLSGKTGVAVIVWILAWAVLHMRLRRSAVETRRALAVALVLIAVGVIGTFPTFFQLFTAE